EQQPVGEQATSLRLSILRELIDNEILMRRAEKLGLLATDEEVDGKLNEIKSPYSKEQFEARLKEKKITVDDFKRDLRRSLTVDKVLNKEITSKINVSDQDVTNYYNAHKDSADHESPRQRRRLRNHRHELFGGSGNLRQRRGPRLRARIVSAQY